MTLLAGPVLLSLPVAYGNRSLHLDFILEACMSWNGWLPCSLLFIHATCLCLL